MIFQKCAFESDECAHKSIMRSNVKQGMVIRFLLVCFLFYYEFSGTKHFFGGECVTVTAVLKKLGVQCRINEVTTETCEPTLATTTEEAYGTADGTVEF